MPFISHMYSFMNAPISIGSAAHRFHSPFIRKTKTNRKTVKRRWNSPAQWLFNVLPAYGSPFFFLFDGLLFYCSQLFSISCVRTNAICPQSVEPFFSLCCSTLRAPVNARRNACIIPADPCLTFFCHMPIFSVINEISLWAGPTGCVRVPGCGWNVG